MPALPALLSAIALAAFAGVTLWLAMRPRARMAALMPSPRWLIFAAMGMTGWCVGLYVFGPGSSQALVIQGLRDLIILAWLGATFWPRQHAPMSRSLRLILRLLLTMCAISFAFGVVAHWHGGAPAAYWVDQALGAVAMLVAVGGLLVVDSAVGREMAGSRMPLAALAGGFAMLWAYELNVELIDVLTGSAPAFLIHLLPGVALLLVPIFAVAAMDVGRERMQLSRVAAMRTILLLGAAVYLILIALTGALARAVGGDHGELAQGTFLIAALCIAALVLLAPRARAWLVVVISKHFFEHRYDYRAEWMRFTATLAQQDDGDGAETNLHRRVAKALAELTGSPGALLLLPGGQDAFRVAEHWHWPTGPAAEMALPRRSAFALQESRHIVDLDALRAGRDAAAADLALPGWLVGQADAWVVVPVLHFQRMIAVAVLHRPPVARGLDWEDLDVLRIAGQQAASYLAEAQGQQALSEARRFDEFNRRFAFIMHDIKNLASQLSLLASNAERHADKPEFRADMIETLKISAGRLSDLLVRLSPRERGRGAGAGRTLIEPVLRAIEAEMRPRGPMFAGSETGLAAWGDPAAIHQVIRHLVANAIDASPPDMPVQVVAVTEQGRVRIDVIDQGGGMTRRFIREDLFKPFVSTKDGGFGLGAFEALQIAQAMGGAIDVVSEPGEGSRFTLWLPHADALDAAEPLNRKTGTA
ncbi:MAG: PEP-CTERM system histidine kinase PrsK [Sphingopyxis macrogoltabida]|uniref:histidine kinase n=1 Tax=Sphingopyxis macrogoltabida TaxID=33050 RepID=A0A2W5L2N2_SPHMC|nr:MAG: PEP-CTERM system histidine kinase PrsK [Sphingopyxis macrogoltabida]